MELGGAKKTYYVRTLIPRLLQFRQFLRLSRQPFPIPIAQGPEKEEEGPRYSGVSCVGRGYAYQIFPMLVTELMIFLRLYNPFASLNVKRKNKIISRQSFYVVHEVY